MLPSKHHIQGSHLNLLCHGYGSAELTRELWNTEFSRRLLMVNSVLDIATEQPELLGPLPPATAAVDLLKDVDDTDRQMFRELLLHPNVGGWASYVLRRLHGFVTSPAPVWTDLGMLHAVAFVAAARTGRDWSTEVPARNGAAMLPTLGMAVFPDSEPWGSVRAETRGGLVTLRRRGHELRLSTTDPRPSGDATWWDLRRIEVGGDPALRVALDDIDPYRDLGEPIEPRRLSASAAQRWRSLLADAWTILCTDHPATAEAMAGGVVGIVPLAGAAGEETRSASTGEASGNVLVSEPLDGLALAVALVHEFAHIQLGGMLHLLSITSGGEEEVYYAPWRDDPRPLPGLIQGIYAFVNIASFWRRQAGLSASTEAEFEYSYARAQVEQALGVAARSGKLTGVGERLVAGLTERVDRWDDGRLSTAAVGAARLVAAGHRAGWRLRHLRPDPSAVDRLVAAWKRGGEAPVLDPGYRVVAGEKRWSQGRLALARRRVRYGKVALDDRLHALGVDDADAALMDGDLPTAATGFAERITADPADLDAWAGLGLAVEGPAGAALLEHPALVRAVHLELRDTGTDPVAVAAWLDRLGRG